MKLTSRNAITAAAVAIIVAMMTTSTPALAQSVQGTPSDLKFEVINATTGAPASVQRMTIDYVRERRNGIIDFEPTGSSFVAPGVPIKDVGEYLVTVWYDDVPYWWTKRGHMMLGETTVLHVFDTARKSDDVVIEGMNIVLRQEGSLLKIEMLLKIENKSSPQVTVYDRNGTFELRFPADADHITAAYRRGPEPTDIKVHQGNARLALLAPLTPGLNSIQLVASVPWQEGMTLPVGSDLEIHKWSLLTAPAWLVVLSNELHQESTGSLPGYTQWMGSKLNSGRQLDLRLSTGPDGPTEATDLFSQEMGKALADEAGRGTEVEEKEGGPSLPLVFGGAMIIILGVVAFRRKMS